MAGIPRRTCIKKMSSRLWQRQPWRFSSQLNSVWPRNTHLSAVVSGSFRFFILVVSGTDITVWIISALLAIGIGSSKYAKWQTRNRLVRELAAMDPERREKVLSRMTPEMAMEARQELMRRFHIS